MVSITNVKLVVSKLSNAFGMPIPRFRLMCRDRCKSVEYCENIACYEPMLHRLNFISFDPPVELVSHEVGHAIYRYLNKCPPFGTNAVNHIENEKFARAVEKWASSNMPHLDLPVMLGVKLLEGFGDFLEWFTS